MIKIKGGKALKGSVRIPGDKITSVHVLFASLFVHGPIIIDNFQFCGDSLRIINWLVNSGLKTVDKRRGQLIVYPTEPRTIDLARISDSRASICAVSALAFQNRITKFSHPGGCGFSFRSIDRHLKWLKTIGMEVTKQQDFYIINNTRSIPSEISFCCSTKFGPSVGVTCQALIFSQVFEGEIVLSEVALEPVILTLVQLLKKQGKRVDVKKSLRQIRIHRGVARAPTSGIKISIPPDQSAAFTFIAAAISTRSTVCLKKVKILYSVKKLLARMNIKTHTTKELTKIDATQPKHPGKVICDVWPAIPSDIGPIICGALANIPGCTVFYDKVYVKRNSHLSELKRLGCQSLRFSHGYLFQVKSSLASHSAKLNATDIRSGASIVVAALGRDCTTYIRNENQINRGYENFFKNLQKIGARVTQINDQERK